ncbi:MAG: DUF3179 domain-containing (seleno)protein [Patescibacteria group bacterium]
MAILVFYLLALIALLVGTAAIYMALLKMVPVSWQYYHYFLRKPVNWIIFLTLVAWSAIVFAQQGSFPFWAIAPLSLSALALVLTYKMHQEAAFPAVDFPNLTTDLRQLPLEDDAQIAVVEYEGVTKCYPLDYVIHHHVVNDRFGDTLVSLTYCAMCHLVIAFDVSDIGPLFVGSFKGANMIVADRKTTTFFQQATRKSIIGKLHPHELTLIPIQQLRWDDVKKMHPTPPVVAVTKKDLREFQLPIPGLWKKIIASNSTPGLSKKQRDNTFPPRTPIIGILDKTVNADVFYLKREVLERGIVTNVDSNFFLVSNHGSVNGFKKMAGGTNIRVSAENGELVDLDSKTRWNMRGKYIAGTIRSDLQPIVISDEYWFSWKEYHKNSVLMRV